MPPYSSAGADAAGDQQIADAFRQIIANDPDIQAVIRRVWGDTPVGQRPSDTPKNLEGANHHASQEIAQILQRKGIPVPDRTFINPRSGALEGHRGWSGLSGVQKALIIAAAAAATGGVAAYTLGPAAAGAGGAGAALPGGVAAPGVTAGLGGALGGATIPVAGASALGAAGTGAGLGTAAAAGGGGLGLSGILGAAGKIGGVLSNASGSQAASRQNDALFNLQRDRATADVYNTAQRSIFDKANTELQQKQFALQAPVTRARQTSLGDLLANIQDVNIQAPAGINVPQITGGLRPSALGPNARAAGGELSRQALMALMNGSDTPTTKLDLLTPPTIREMPQAGGAERVTGQLGTILGLAGTLGEVFGKQKPRTVNAY